MNQKIFPLLMTTFATFTLSTSTLIAKSQSANNCFIQGKNGEVINLSNLCGRNNSRRKKSTQSFKVKIKRRLGGIPVIDVTFNQKKSYEMLLDTGASGTVLTLLMVEQLGLKPEGYVMVRTPSSKAVAFPTTTVNSIKVGTVELKQAQVVVSPSLSLGLLGQDFFGSYDMTISKDYIIFKRR